MKLSGDIEGLHCRGVAQRWAARDLAFAPVAFDDLSWQDDLRRATGSAKRIGEETRSLGRAVGSCSNTDRRVKGMAKTEAFRDLSADVRSRPGAAAEINTRKRAIVAAVRRNELRKQRG